MSPRPKVALEKQNIIIEAAALANEYGPESVTLAMLAKKLKIKPPSLYNHFEGLPGLKRELAIFSLEKLFRDLTGAAFDQPPGTAKVLGISEAYLSFARKNPGLYEFALSAPDPEDKEVFKAGKSIVDLVVEAIKPFNLSEDVALHAVRGLRSIMHGFASLEQKGGFGLSLDLEESYQLTVKAFLAGLEK